ncbi:MAG: exonuclease SbcCD subunit D [Oscillospiraceae bacterium]|nr:exonuclease SbcCD subunit D [Oscillospiraceae bacterium]
MRFLHLADLHIGKVLHRHSMIPDQKYILQQILQIADAQQVDAVLIAGDIYQRNTPSPEAMTVFSDFLSALAGKNLPCYLISGNHDSAERVAYLSALAEQSGIHIAGAEGGTVYSYQTEDAFGALTIHLLPYCTPAIVRQRYPEEAAQIRSYEDAVRTVLSKFPVSGEGRNVLVCHQFLTGAVTCDSEELAIGGLDNISAELFDAYDYVALGHLHGPQHVSCETVRYAGSPLKYSFSELHQHKSVTVVDLKEKGNVTVTAVPLTPLHGMQELPGTLEALLQHEPTEDYVHVLLLDEEPPADAVRQLRTVFPNLLQMTVRNSKFREDRTVSADSRPEYTDFLKLFSEFYAFQNAGAAPNDRQQEIVRRLLEQIDGEVQSE